MKGQTLADVFYGADLKGSARQLFSLEDIEKTADLAAAETVDNARKLVDSLVARAADRLFDISLMEIMVSAWAKMVAIQEYATGEKLLSKKTHKFVLSEHKITSKHSPKIALYVYDNKVTEMTVDISLTLVMAKTILKIKQGRILEVRISGCQAIGNLSCYGQEILEEKSAELDFPSAIKLGDGIEIPPPLKIKVA
ncbi:MAG: hypothetical protein QNK22_04985 [Xanthomonadales bacterium]|nr:hypothetical protein [Xanthomonadales bacterium]